ncbi:hypothetical protein AB1K83_15100 [Sporosarcina sp. 179-K 3D1 HS]|uniref:alpha/beta fold hydrolase n=1 Tax=Sporosarcina sp. 179-K 3D1 HS TaxID=3232169 RepID=UPI0039A28BCE
MEIRPIHRKRKRIYLLFSSFLFAVFVILFSYHTSKSNLSYSVYPPVGEMVDLGDYQLHMYAIGEKNDIPTVILESGSGTPSSVSDWRYIQPELAKMTRVISYDRAGYGWSDTAYND